MKTNEELKYKVTEALNREKSMHDAKIEISITDGIVTLSGTMDCHFKLSEAANTLKEMDGVKEIIQEIEIVSPDDSITDDKILENILSAFKSHWDIPAAKINTTVKSGTVTLSGELDWNYQRDAAVHSTCNLKGVKRICNKITIKSSTSLK